MGITFAKSFTAKSLIVLGLVSIIQGGCAPKNSSGWDPEKGLQGTISVSGAFALYPLVVLWSEQFKKVHPHVRFNISAGGAGKGIADALTGMVDIGLVSRDIHPQEFDRGGYAIHVARDAVVATVSEQNPNLEPLLQHGVKQDEFKRLFIDGTVSEWSQVNPMFTNDDLHVYVRSDAAGAAETWAAYLGKSQEDLKGIGIFGDPGMAQAVQKNPMAIGFNNINYVYNIKTGKQFPGIRVVPIDLNSNGTLEPDEDFYTELDSLIDAVATKKYPSPPSRNLSFLVKGKPTDVVLIEFIKFVLTSEAQSLLLENGYTPLNDEQLLQERTKLN